jgi:ABC-2 type transport system permease protein
VGALGGALLWIARPEPGREEGSLAFGVLDRTGVLYEAIERAAGQRNTAIEAGRRWGTRFVPSRVEPGGEAAESSLEHLDARVRTGDLAAFVEIPADAAEASDSPARIYLHARSVRVRELGLWLEDVVESHLRTRALRASGLSSEVRAQLERKAVAELVEPGARGKGGGESVRVRDALALLRRGPARALVSAFALNFLVFAAITFASSPLMQGVVEEKMSRVSEILLSSVSPFQLMLGKLLAGLGAAGVVAGSYLAVGLLVAAGVLGFSVPAGVLVLGLVYLVLGVLLYGSLYLAIGAACADLKDTQNLVPLVLMQAFPIFPVVFVALEPSSSLAVAASLFPPATPFLMPVRAALDPPPPAWQIVVSIALTGASALGGVWVAGRVFRVGLLSQGKSASLREIVRWARTG